jgi:hypothetical protein
MIIIETASHEKKSQLQVGTFLFELFKLFFEIFEEVTAYLASFVFLNSSVAFEIQ